MNSRKALGKGIMALMPDTDELPRDLRQQGLLELDVHQIRSNPYQPRIEFAAGALEELKQSIREKGVISPVLVRRTADGFELVAGERRLRAVRELGYKKVPAIVKDIKNESELLELALIENIQREQLNPIEEARAYRGLQKEYSYTQEQVAAKVGKDRATVANSLRLLNLPTAVQELVFHNQLSMGHARALLGIKSPQKQEQLAHRAAHDGLSVRSIEKLVREAEGKKTAAPAGKKPKARGRFTPFEEELRRTLGTKVTIRESNGKGTIGIEFYSEDDLERIVEILS
jgi:ParB family chromosome partitioning protein